MKRLFAAMSMSIAAAILAIPIFGQIPTQSPPPSAEQMAKFEEMAKEMKEFRKSMLDKLFERSDEDDNGSLSKEELVEFAVAMSLAELEALRGRLSGVPEPTEEEIKQVKERELSDADRLFPMIDTDKSGGISKKELLTGMYGEDYSDDEEDDDKKEDESGASELDSGEEASDSDDVSGSASEEP